MRSYPALVLGAALAGVMTGALAGSIVGTTERDPRVHTCGLEGDVAAVFDLAQARRIWTYLPAMKQAPELEVDTPASIVLYSGATRGVSLGPAGTLRRDENTGVVCVILMSGEIVVYANVSRSGFTAP